MQWLMLAWRNILRNRRRTVLTLISLTGGYWVVVLVLSANAGSYDQVLAQYTQDRTGHVQILAPGYLEQSRLQRTLDLSEAEVAAWAQAAGATAWAPRIESGALAYGDTHSLPVQVLGMSAEHDLQQLARRMTEGEVRWQSHSVYPPALIGARVAQYLNLELGAELVLLAQAADGSLANDLFEVVGILGALEDDSARWVVLPLSAAQDFYALPNQVHRWLLFADTHQRSMALAQRLRSTQPAASEWELYPWQVIESEFYEMMQADQQGGNITSLIVIFLVCIGVLNTILMSVFERMGEFGVLKAIGTSDRRLFLLVMSEAALLAMIAILLGIVLALPANLWLTLVGIPMPEPIAVSGLVFSHFQGRMSWAVFFWPAVLIAVMTLLVALYPAWRVVRWSPLTAMRRL